MSRIVETAHDRLAPERKRNCVVAGVFGAIVLGVLVPCTLAAMQATDPLSDGPSTGPSTILQYVLRVIVLCVLACFSCIQGAALLSMGIMAVLRRQIMTGSHRTHETWIRRGCVLGTAAAFLNLPGYLAGSILPDDELLIIRMITLFAVTGATCGAWLGWQIWRETNLTAKLMPHFSLGMLIALTLGWGMLLALFVPMPA